MRLLVIRFALAVFASLSFGQTNLGTAALGGVVRDSSGAYVPVSIEATETDRGLKHETKSNEDGAFLIPTVPPGRYTLRVTKEGFEATEITGIVLEVGARPSLDVNLSPGRITSVTSVTGESIPQLDTVSNVIGSVIDSARVQELPLNGRNYLQLALLSGGAVQPTGRSDAISGQTGRSDNAVLLGGNVGSSTGYMVDGIAVRGGRLGESALNLSPAVDRPVQSPDELLHARPRPESWIGQSHHQGRFKPVSRRGFRILP